MEVENINHLLKSSLFNISILCNTDDLMCGIITPKEGFFRRLEKECCIECNGKERNIESKEKEFHFDSKEKGDYPWELESLKHIYRSGVIIPTQTHSNHVEIIDSASMSNPPSTDPTVPLAHSASMDHWDSNHLSSLEKSNIYANTASQDYPDTDALISFIPGKAIGVITADCVPILIYAPDVKGVVAIHAGWKGTLNGIVDKTLEKLKVRGANPAKMMVWFGPSRCKECYEVDQELADKFINAGYQNCIITSHSKTGKPHIDLQKVNIQRLTDNGVPPENILKSKECTKTSNSCKGHFQYPSYRRDGVKSLRLLTFISLKK